MNTTDVSATTVEASTPYKSATQWCGRRKYEKNYSFNRSRRAALPVRQNSRLLPLEDQNTHANAGHRVVHDTVELPNKQPKKSGAPFQNCSPRRR